jgi:hypothetical protein
LRRSANLGHSLFTQCGLAGKALILGFFPTS